MGWDEGIKKRLLERAGLAGGQACELSWTDGWPRGLEAYYMHLHVPYGRGSTDIIFSKGVHGWTGWTTALGKAGPTFFSSYTGILKGDESTT